MKALGWAGAAALVVSLAPATAQERVFEKPYFVDRPVIEAIGRAWIETRANRASFSVTFVEEGKEADAVAARAAERARLAAAALRAKADATQAQLQSNLSIEALYEQYRDEEGNRRDNAREDKISGYVARAQMNVTMLDIAKLAEARGAVLAAKPEEAGAVSYELVPTAEMQRKAYEAAVDDAAKRAKASAAAAGATLGPLIVVQEGQGPCLGQWGYDTGGYDGPRAYAAAPPPPPAPSGMVVTASRIGGKEVRITEQDIARLSLPSDPPTRRVSANVCVVYKAGG